MQINPEKACYTSLPPHGKDSSGLLARQVMTVMILNSSCFICLDSTEVTHAQGERKNLEGFEGFIEEGGMEGLRTRGMEGLREGGGAGKMASRHRRGEERDLGGEGRKRGREAFEGVFDSTVKGSHQEL